MSEGHVAFAPLTRSWVGPITWPEGSAPPAAGTLPALVDAEARTAPDAIAVRFDGEVVTYRELATRGEKVAGALTSLGLGPGARIGLLAPNSIDWIAAALGIVRRGATVHAFNTWVKPAELDYLLRASGVDALISIDAFGSTDVLETLAELAPEAWSADPGRWHSVRYPSLRVVAVMGDRQDARGFHAWDEVVVEASHGAEDLSCPDDASVVVYTSGSTQFPKAVPLTQRLMIDNGFAIGERMHLSRADRVWFASPLFWSFGVANALMATFTHGASLVLDSRFEVGRAVHTLRRESCTAAYLLPTMVEALCAEAGAVRSLAQLRTGLTIGRPDEVTRVVDELGIDGICNVYGLTEVFGNCCVTDAEDDVSLRIASQGLPLPGVEVRVVDETGTILPSGDAGQIEVRGRTMPGYLVAVGGEPAPSPFTVDGWFRTGDTGRLRTDGRLEFIGRHSEMIKMSGINVSPAEIEARLRTHPAVDEAAVVGVADPHKGEVPVAFVVSVAGITEEECLAHCRTALSAYKIPARVTIVDALPVTATGKLSRKLLLDLARSPGPPP